MALIDYTYFQKRLLAIPNLNQEEIVGNLNNYIALHEPLYLESVLGYAMNKEFQEALAGTPAQKWIDLRDGAEYTDKCGSLQKWNGFVTSTKESPIAYYNYFYLVREGNTMLTGTGTVESKNENSNRVEPLVKLVDAYRYMVGYNRQLAAFIEANDSDYPTYAPTDKLIENIYYFGF
jgi:hypothetical protein